MDSAAPDTRTRILRTALDLFAEKGYQRTSLREIAERLRLTKAAILYHFPSKEHLVIDLVEPLLSDLEGLLDTAEHQPPERARWVVVEGWIDVILAHRRSLGMLFHDISMFSHGPTFARLLQIAMRANELVAGPDAGRRDQVRAVQAIAMCSDPVLFFNDVPDEVLRADMLDGPRRLFADPTPAATGTPPGPAGTEPVGAGAGIAEPGAAVGTGGGGRMPVEGGAVGPGGAVEPVGGGRMPVEGGAGRRGGPRRAGRPRAMS
ncbi:helix-turn-helix domain-containing protein, partial [Micromonospora sp. NPDC000207]|uniref:TetR/AcrR family transcriptional regulator n=1 Tax=Micromonospora sp. NPDC000207 TaxID=3154246 RepID=UPI00332EFDA0